MTRPEILKTAIFIIWIILLGMLVKRDILIKKIDIREIQALENARRQEFQGVYFKKRKIGYIQSTYTPNKDQSLTVDQKGYLVLNILEKNHPINLHLIAVLNKDSRLQRFSLSFKSPFYLMNAEGVVENKKVSFTLNTNNSVIHDTILLNDTPMLSSTRRGYLLQQNPAIGEKIRVPWFDPVSLVGKDSIVEYRGKEKILIHKRIFNLHHFIERFEGTRVNIYLDDQGQVIKEESPAGFVFIKEPKFKATELDETSSDILAAVSIPLTGKMIPLTNRQFIRYRLQLPEQVQFDLDGGRQSFDGDILTIKKERIPSEDSQANTFCSNQDTELESTPYIQVNHNDITQKRQLILGNEDHRIVQVKLLADWIFKNIEKRPVVGLPDALTTLGNGLGDCNEHAALFAALARNAGIPTRFVAGVTYNRGSFYYHAWNEVCVNEKWVSLDTTVNQYPADLTHIRFIIGGIREQMRISSLIGKLAIEIVNDTP